MNKSSNVAAAFIAGAAIGAVAALLTSPGSGAENRKKIKQKAEENKKKAMQKKDQMLSKAQEKTGEARDKAAQMADKASRRISQAAEDQKGSVE